ncbi:hypothetical protein FRC08_007981 [Ceratobasidium sp. 394]|nr:hypothetical protein FRC08_007981 [Ceratobasidium sp. 394]
MVVMRFQTATSIASLGSLGANPPPDPEHMLFRGFKGGQTVPAQRNSRPGPFSAGLNPEHNSHSMLSPDELGSNIPAKFIVVKTEDGNDAKITPKE